MSARSKTGKVLEAVDALAVELHIGSNGLAFTWDQLEALNRILDAYAHELAEKIRWAHPPSDADQRFAVYVNGWCDGRNEAADLIDPEVE